MSFWRHLLHRPHSRSQAPNRANPRPMATFRSLRVAVSALRSDLMLCHVLAS
jgi:hypothetical protein